MLPTHTILFPTDFSEKAQQTFALACSLARDCGARLVVLYVVLPPMGREQLEIQRDPDHYYAGLWKMLHEMQAPNNDVRVEHRLEEGHAPKRILEVAQEMDAGLIVLGTHGRTGLGRLLLGSVAEQIVRKAGCPVLTVRIPSSAETTPECHSTWPVMTILHPSDFSACSKDALQLACSLAKDCGARLIVLHVTSVPDKGNGSPGLPLVREEYLAKVRQDLNKLQPPDPQLFFETRVEEGDPVTEILRVAEETRAGLIVMGTHGRTGLGHLLMGSVAEQVVRKGPCLVLTLKTPTAIVQGSSQ